MTTSVLLIHGLWTGPESFDGWRHRYEAAGLDVIAPRWPRSTGGVEAVSFADVVRHFADVVLALPTPPIVIGHSFGGAVAQVLLDRGLCAAGIVVNTTPVGGVRNLPVESVLAIWPVVRNPANRNRDVELTRHQFHAALANGLPRTVASSLWATHGIAGSGRVLFESLRWRLVPSGESRVTFRNPFRAPLLFMAGGCDRLSPPSVVRANFRKSRVATAPTNYRGFAGRSHMSICEAGWQELADYALDWAIDQVTTTSIPPGTRHWRIRNHLELAPTAW